MKPEFTADGISVQTFDEIFTELADGYRAIYGPDINLDPDSPDGQRVAIEAQARLDSQSFALALYQQLDPDFAIGVALNRAIKFAGIARRPASLSQVDVTVTTDRALTLPDDYTVEDTLGQEWITNAEVVLASGANTVTLFSGVYGAVEADAGTVTNPSTVVLGVVSVTNPAAATVGRDEETDEQLRIRRRLSIQNPASSSVGGLFSVLGNLANVTDLAIYENDTKDYRADIDLDANSLWIVVEGGAVAEIAEAMAKNKTGGTGLKGSIKAAYTEAIVRPDGSEFTFIHEMKFDRPTERALHVRLNATRKVASEPIDTAAIAAAITERTFGLYETAVASELYQDAYQAGTNFVATDLEISDDGAAWTEGKIELAPDQKFTIALADVTVTEV